MTNLSPTQQNALHALREHRAAGTAAARAAHNAAIGGLSRIEIAEMIGVYVGRGTPYIAGRLIVGAGYRTLRALVNAGHATIVTTPTGTEIIIATERT